MSQNKDSTTTYLFSNGNEIGNHPSRIRAKELDCSDYSIINLWKQRALLAEAALEETNYCCEIETKEQVEAIKKHGSFVKENFDKSGNPKLKTLCQK